MSKLVTALRPLNLMAATSYASAASSCVPARVPTVMAIVRTGKKDRGRGGRAADGPQRVRCDPRPRQRENKRGRAYAWHGMAWQPYAKKDPSLYLSLYP